MPSRTLIAAAIGIPLLIGGTVLVVKASSSSSDSDAPVAKATADQPAKTPHRAPPTLPVKPKLPPYERPPAEAQPAPTTPPVAATGDVESSTKPADPAATTDPAKRREIARAHGRQVPEFAMRNPGVMDSATKAEVDAKAEIIRKRGLMDKFACNAPESKERLELLAPAERAKWEARCAAANSPGGVAVPRTR